MPVSKKLTITNFASFVTPLSPKVTKCDTSLLACVKHIPIDSHLLEFTRISTFLFSVVYIMNFDRKKESVPSGFGSSIKLIAGASLENN